MASSKNFQIICRPTSEEVADLDDLAEWAENLPINTALDLGEVLIRDFPDLTEQFPHFSFPAVIENEFSYVYEMGEDEEGIETETFVECNWTISSQETSTIELVEVLSRAFDGIQFQLVVT